MWMNGVKTPIQAFVTLSQLMLKILKGCPRIYFSFKVLILSQKSFIGIIFLLSDPLALCYSDVCCHVPHSAAAEEDCCCR